MRKRRDIRRKIKELAIGTVALLTMTVPMVGTAAAQNLEESSSEPLPVDASPRTLGCGTATNIGHANMAPLYVDGFPCLSPPQFILNTAYTNIKICAPGNKTNCQVIDHVIVDTGSVGLRIASSVVNSKLLQAMPHVPTSGPQILTNCSVFASGQALYGPVQTADVYIADKFAGNFPLQIFGKNLTPPAGCGDASQPPGGVSDLGANGLVGVGFKARAGGGYYSCNTDGSNCAPQDTNPSIATPNLVSKLQNDNNGLTIALNNIPDLGATVPVLGLLIFGVGTQADNTPPEGTIPLLADISLIVENNTGRALIDSGTPFVSVTGPQPLSSSCQIQSTFLCPPPPPDNTATIMLGLASNGASTPAYCVNYTVANADELITSLSDTAFNDLLNQGSSSGVPSILGLSVFFGRTMYFVFDGKQSPLGTGPINAMAPQQSCNNPS
jgi:hypothetical protein